MNDPAFLDIDLALDVTVGQMKTARLARGRDKLDDVWKREFGAARSVSADAWSLSMRFNLIGLLANNLALLAAFEGRFADAARVAGYANHQSALRGADRQPNETRAVREAERIAASALGAEAVRSLLAEGTSMTEAKVRMLAFESRVPGTWLRG